MKALRHFAASVRAYAGVWLAVCALGFGALAFVGTRSYISAELDAERLRLRPREDTVEVVVARRDLRKGEPVGADTMAVRAIPRDYVPGTAIKPNAFDQHAGSRLAVPMRSGEPLLASALNHPDGSVFSSQVRKGVRAMTVAVDEVNSISGMLQPGDRIDLLLTYTPAARGGRAESNSELTLALMQDVLVMATGKQVRPQAGAGGVRAFTTVTIEAEPAQAQRLVVAQRSGRLTAVLRHPDDRERIAKRVMDQRVLDGLARVGVPYRDTAELIVGGRGQLERQQQNLDPLPARRGPVRDRPLAVQTIVPTAVPDLPATEMAANAALPQLSGASTPQPAEVDGEVSK